MSGGRETEDLGLLAERLVELGRRAGADEVEVAVGEGTEFNVDVRLGRVENLVEAGSRVLGLRVIKDKRTAFASTSDLTWSTLRRLVRNAVRRAELASRDEFAGLAPLSATRVDPLALDLHDPEIRTLDAAAKVRLALTTERIARADKRITNSHGASFITNESRTLLVNSNGFRGAYDQTYCGLGVSLQAGGTDDRVEDSWSSSKRRYRDLASPEEIARMAVARTVRQLNPRKVATQRVPVIFEPTQTAWLMGFLFSCVSGVAVYQRASFLADRLGQRVGNERVTVIDDALLPGGLGSRPFDSDGLPSGRHVVVDRGMLQKYLCNIYAARKLGLPSTGSADGTGVSPANFFFQPGTRTAREIIASTRKGFLLVRTLGHGLNPTTGDISRGAFGLWIENGEIAYPVSEVTISGNLGELLEAVEEVGNDLEFHGAVAGPTLKVAEMTVAGS